VDEAGLPDQYRRVLLEMHEALREFNAGRLNTTWNLVEDGRDAR